MPVKKKSGFILPSVSQLYDLSGKGAIVTGGAMGIGQAICFRLAEAGAAVMVTDIDLDAAGQTVERIKSRGGKAEAMYADVTSPVDAEESVKASVESFGRLDILVNNAGIYPTSAALQISEEMWERVLNTNLKGLFFYSLAAAQQMIRSGQGGKIVNIASMGALHPMGNMSHYDASKAAVVALTRSLALEFASHSILINAVAPGAIMTTGGKAKIADLQGRSKSIEEDVASLTARIPMGRAGKPDDIAKVVLFLASAAADYMTGSVVIVDGGYLLS